MTEEPTLRHLMLAEDPSFEDVLRCVFGLHERDVATYRAVAAHDRVSAQALAAALERDRSTVTRSLERLREKGVVEREREIPSHGGERYCYVALPLPRLRDRMHDELDAWAKFVHDRIDDFDDAAVTDS